MIMRITWGKLRPGCWQEHEQAYRTTVADKEVPGLRGPVAGPRCPRS